MFNLAFRTIIMKHNAILIPKVILKQSRLEKILIMPPKYLTQQTSLTSHHHQVFFTISTC